MAGIDGEAEKARLDDVSWINCKIFVYIDFSLEKLLYL